MRFRVHELAGSALLPPVEIVDRFHVNVAGRRALRFVLIATIERIGGIDGTGARRVTYDAIKKGGGKG